MKLFQSVSTPAVIAGIAAGVLLCGCGSDEPAAAPNGPREAGLKRRDPERRQPEANRPAPPPRAKTRTAAPAKETTPPAANPDDSFAVVGPGPEFEIVGTAPAADADDLFAAIVPPDGVDSTQYEIFSQPDQRPPGRPDRSFRLPDGFEAMPAFGYSQDGWPLRILCTKDHAELSLVPAGIFVLGSNEGPPEARPELPVYLDSYYIDVTEVTLGQYESFRASEDARRRSRSGALNADAGPEFPALGIRWHDAERYADWAGRALPTEAEWEKAARSEEGFDYVWGRGRALWPRVRTLEQIDPVKSFAADVSEYRVFDLAGNAREWCQDMYSDVAFQEAAQANADALRNWTGPRRPSTEYSRVVKGNGPDWVAWWRIGRNERQQHADVGFRCVLRPGRMGDDAEKRRRRAAERGADGP